MKFLLNGINKKSEILRWLIFCFLCVVPLVFVIKGIVRLCQGELITFAFSFTLFIIPILIITGNFYIIKDKNTSVLGKSVLSILLVVVLSIIGLVIVFFGTFKELHSFKGEDAIDKYNSTVFNECAEMPSLSDIGDYISISYYEYDSYFILGSPSANTVIFKYDNDDYEIEKQKIEAQYIFQEDSYKSSDVVIDGYSFRMLSPQDYCDYYPKHVRFIANNDETKEVIHVDFCDVELDYIESVEDFILNDCGFKYIK